MSKCLLSDEEISEIAGNIIKELAVKATAKFSGLTISERDGRVELIYQVPSRISNITFCPQKIIERKLRKIEEWAIDNLEDIVPPEYFYASVYQQVCLGDEDVEVKTLIEEFPRLFQSNFSKLEDKADALLALAKKKRDSIRKQVEQPWKTAAKCMEFAKLVNEVKPIWKYIIEYFKNNDYGNDVSTIYTDVRFKELSKEYEIPNDLMKEVFKKKDKSRTQKRELEPLAFAFKHAQRKLAIKTKRDALDKMYYRGQKYLEDVTQIPGI